MAADQKRARREIDSLNERASALAAGGMLADAMTACIRSLQPKETSAAKALFVRLDDRWRSYRWLAASEDFYDTSGCRDLLFHVREHRFTLPRIKQVLAELELDFLRFNVDSAVQQR